VQPEPRSRAAFHGLADRDAAADAATGKAERGGRAEHKERDGNKRQQRREPQGQGELNEQQCRADRHLLQRSCALGGSRNVIQQQRLHARLSDGAGERPATPRQRCRSAQPQVRFIFRLDPRDHDAADEQQQPSKRHRGDERGQSGQEPLVRRPRRRPRSVSENKRIAAADCDRCKRHDHQQAKTLGQRAAEHQRDRLPQTAARKSSIVGKKRGNAARLGPAQVRSRRRRDD
jgi:hypothetical protein